jgi:DNA-binding transcriptional ArsR family regulator
MRKQILSHIFAIKYLHNMEIRRDVFQAIADPTRRAIIGMVAQKPINVNTIAEQFDVSRQAISLHLKILSECGLLNIQRLGRERLYEAKLEKLNEVHEWVEQYHKLWTGRLNALKKFIEQEELQPQTINTISKNIKKIKNGKSRQ